MLEYFITDYTMDGTVEAIYQNSPNRVYKDKEITHTQSCSILYERILK